MGLLAAGGCASVTGGHVEPLPIESAMHRREALSGPARGSGFAAATQPAEPLAVLERPFKLNPPSILQFIYYMSPSVTASREDMVSAEHALEEFKANLSRFEPFVEASGDYSDFPKRREAHGTTGEVVGGIEKETFEGARIRLEGGASTSRFMFDKVDEGEESIEEGDGAVLRARVEVPFIGSRRRQERVISQAFQESQARKARLDFLSDYRTLVISALQYYRNAIWYLGYARAYERQLAEIEKLLGEERVKPEGRSRLESSAANASVSRDQWQAWYRDSLLTLVTTLGITPEDDYELVEPQYAESPYVEQSSTPEGRQAMLDAAYRNNPTFRVLSDAIEDAELQRKQAILGQYDITAFLQADQFPFGAETFDDRVEGWTVRGGVSVRLNDRRVLTSSRLKAEAQIRQFRAQIDAEKLRIQRQIATETDTLQSNHELRVQAIKVIEAKRRDYEKRLEDYLAGDPQLAIDDVLRPLQELTSAEINLAQIERTIGLSESSLMAATGDVYRLVGMQMDDGELPDALNDQ